MSDIVTESVGSNIRQARLRAGLSQQALLATWKTNNAIEAGE